MRKYVRPVLFCCVCTTYSVPSFNPPSAEREATTTHNGKVQPGRADIVSDITLFLPFPWSFLFPIKIQDSPRSCFVSNSPALFPLVVSLFGLFVCFLPSPSLLCAFPWLLTHHLFSPHSFQTSPVALCLTYHSLLGETCHTSRLGLMGLCNPPASHLHTSQQIHYRISCSQLRSCSVA